MESVTKQPDSELPQHWNTNGNPRSIVRYIRAIERVDPIALFLVHTRNDQC